MTHLVSVSATQERLEQARSRLDLIGQSGASDKYMECYFLVEALELQLQRLLDAPPPQSD